MCIAIYKPEKTWLNEDTLQACWDNNPHGAGFMYAEKRKLCIQKGFMTYEAFKEAYEPHKGKTAVLHFRIRTHGDTNEQNTHPFVIHKNLGVVHNGIISKINCETDKTMSDTHHFTQQILAPLSEGNPSFWHEPAYQTLLADYIGHSKLIMMDNFGDVEIINENLGVWNSECWFSNTGYTARTYQTHQKTNYKRKANGYEGYELDSFPIQNKSRPIAQANLVMGDFATLLYEESVTNPDYPNEKFLAGTRVKIEYFGIGTHITVSNPLNGKRAVTSSYKLEKYVSAFPSIVRTDPVFQVNSDVIFQKNHNHFRIGDIKTVSAVTENYVLVKYNALDSKAYAIPRDAVSPLEKIIL